MVGDILVTEGINAGGVVLGPAADGQGRRRPVGRWRDARPEDHRRHAARRRQGHRRRGQRAGRPDPHPKGDRDPGASTSCATRTAGSTSRRWATWSPTRMRAKYPERRGRLHQLRRPAPVDIRIAPPTAGEGDRRHHRPARCSRVLPFGNATVIETLTGAQMTSVVPQRLLGRSATRTRRSTPAGSRRSPGLVVTFHCSGTTPVVDGIWKTPDGPGGTKTPLGRRRHDPVRHQRLHVHRRRRLHASSPRART